MAEIEIGIGKSGRQAYGFDDIAIVPSRRTRDPEDVDLSWEIDAYKFDLPLMASAMDSAVSPETAVEIGRLGGLAVLNLEGLWTRYEDPTVQLEEIASLPAEKATRRMQEIYQEPLKPELIGRRICGAAKRRDRDRRQPHSPAGRGVRRPHRRSRPPHPRHPGNRGLGRARLEPVRAAQPQGVHPGIRAAGHRRRRCLVLHHPSPHAHRRRRGPGWRRTRRRLHDPGRPRHRRAAGHGHRRRRRSPHEPIWTKAVATCTSLPTAACGAAATSPRPSPAEPTPS